MEPNAPDEKGLIKGRHFSPVGSMFCLFLLIPMFLILVGSMSCLLFLLPCRFTRSPDTCMDLDSTCPNPNPQSEAGSTRKATTRVAHCFEQPVDWPQLRKLTQSDPWNT